MRKQGMKLKKRVAAVLKKLDKSNFAKFIWYVEDPTYKQLKELKKNMDNLQDDCDVGQRI
jgi:hypothetical protein